MREGSDLFTVHAYLPAEASFGFADELRRRSSGAASASLMLSHWERLQVGRGGWRARRAGRARRGWGCRGCCRRSTLPSPSHPHGPCPGACLPAQLSRLIPHLSDSPSPPHPPHPPSTPPQVDPFFVPLTEEEREEFGEEGQVRAAAAAAAAA